MLERFSTPLARHYEQLVRQGVLDHLRPVLATIHDATAHGGVWWGLPVQVTLVPNMPVMALDEVRWAAAKMGDASGVADSDRMHFHLLSALSDDTLTRGDVAWRSARCCFLVDGTSPTECEKFSRLMRALNKLDLGFASGTQAMKHWHVFVFTTDDIAGSHLSVELYQSAARNFRVVRRDLPELSVEGLVASVARYLVDPMLPLIPDAAALDALAAMVQTKRLDCLSGCVRTCVRAADLASAELVARMRLLAHNSFHHPNPLRRTAGDGTFSGFSDTLHDFAEARCRVLAALKSCLLIVDGKRDESGGVDRSLAMQRRVVRLWRSICGAAPADRARAPCDVAAVHAQELVDMADIRVEDVQRIINFVPAGGAEGCGVVDEARDFLVGQLCSLNGAGSDEAVRRHFATLSLRGGGGRDGVGYSFHVAGEWQQDLKTEVLFALRNVHFCIPPHSLLRRVVAERERRYVRDEVVLDELEAAIDELEQYMIIRRERDGGVTCRVALTFDVPDTSVAARPADPAPLPIEAAPAVDIPAPHANTTPVPGARGRDRGGDAAAKAVDVPRKLALAAQRKAAEPSEVKGKVTSRFAQQVTAAHGGWTAMIASSRKPRRQRASNLTEKTVVEAGDESKDKMMEKWLTQTETPGAGDAPAPVATPSPVRPAKTKKGAEEEVAADADADAEANVEPMDAVADGSGNAVVVSTPAPATPVATRVVPGKRASTPLAVGEGTPVTCDGHTAVPESIRQVDTAHASSESRPDHVMVDESTPSPSRTPTRVNMVLVNSEVAGDASTEASAAMPQTVTRKATATALDDTPVAGMGKGKGKGKESFLKKPPPGAKKRKLADVVAEDAEYARDGNAASESPPSKRGRTGSTPNARTPARSSAPSVQTMRMSVDEEPGQYRIMNVPEEPHLSGVVIDSRRVSEDVLRASYHYIMDMLLKMNGAPADVDDFDQHFPTRLLDITHDGQKKNNVLNEYKKALGKQGTKGCVRWYANEHPDFWCLSSFLLQRLKERLDKVKGVDKDVVKKIFGWVYANSGKAVLYDAEGSYPATDLEYITTYKPTADIDRDLVERGAESFFKRLAPCLTRMCSSAAEGNFESENVWITAIARSGKVLVGQEMVFSSAFDYVRHAVNEKFGKDLKEGCERALPFPAWCGVRRPLESFFVERMRQWFHHFGGFAGDGRYRLDQAFLIAALYDPSTSGSKDGKLLAADAALDHSCENIRWRMEFGEAPSDEVFERASDEEAQESSTGRSVMHCLQYDDDATHVEGAIYDDYDDDDDVSVERVRVASVSQGRSQSRA